MLKLAGAWGLPLHGLSKDGRDTLFLLAVLGFTVLAQVPNLPAWCTLATAGVLVWRAILALRGAPLPKKRWLLAMLLVCAVLTWNTHKTLLGRDAGVTLVVVLLALKTMELRARRDAFVVFFLGFFTLLTNFLYSQSLPTAAAMLVSVWGLLTALVNSNMQVGKHSLWLSGRIALGMAAMGAPIMLALFLFFPRVAPLWGIPSDGMSGRSGLSGSMQVGALAKLALDESVALRVEWLQQDGSPGAKPPPPQDLYFRGPVFSTFDGAQWKPLQTSFRRLAPLALNLQTTGPAVRARITQEPNNRPWLFVPEVTPLAPKAAGLELSMGEDLQWKSARPITDVTRFEAISYPQFRHGPHRQHLLLQDQLDLPPGFNPRTLQLALDLRREPRFAQAGAAVLVPAVLEKLRTGGYYYTLEPGVYGTHTADEFWFDQKAGFCEHIASAFVVLMRALDVPARVVTGYQGGDVNRVDGVWTVRQSDAHAWAEVWFDGRGWVRVDPTASVAPNRVSQSARLVSPAGVFGGAMATLSPRFTLELRSVWEAVNNAWSQRVLNYTQGKQLDVLRALGVQSPSWQDMAYLLIGAVVLMSTAGALWTLLERYERDPWRRLLNAARDRLAQLGVPSHAATPPRELALRVRGRWGEQGAEVAAWLLAFEEVRYGLGSGSQALALSGLRRGFRSLRWPRT